MHDENAVARELLAHCLRHERIARSLAEHIGSGPVATSRMQWRIALVMVAAALIPLLFLPH